jgi:hypothetical protein
LTAVLVPDAAWSALLQHPAVRFEDERLDVCDLVLLGLLTGPWRRFADVARHGLALELADDEPLAAADVRAAATAFRYARGLVSAAEFTAWLRERDLTLSEVSDALARQLRVQRAAGDDARRARGEDLAGVLRVDALCDGVLAALAEAAIDRLAAAHRLGERAPADGAPDRTEAAITQALRDQAAGLATLGEAELRRRLRRVAALDAALSQLREEVAEPEAIAGCLAAHRLDWLRLNGDELALAEPGAAREARMLMREDDLTPAEVAARAGVPVQPRSIYLEDVPAEAGAAFAAAAPGEVIGPWYEDSAWRVLFLMNKNAPTPDDDLLAQRAADELLAGVLERHRAGRSELCCVL